MIILYGRYSYISIFTDGETRHREVLYFFKITQPAELGFKLGPSLSVWYGTRLYTFRGSMSFWASDL
jgi:hypothetical protein